MINGQALGKTAKLRYGLFPMSFNGCEVISVYNALEFLNIPQEINDVRKYMERYAVLGGFFGCNIYRIGKVLNHFGAESEKVKSVGSAEAVIVSSWTGKPFLSTIHTVFCVCDNNEIKVYNRYNNLQSCMKYSSFEKIFSGRKPLVIYKLRQEYKNE